MLIISNEMQKMALLSTTILMVFFGISFICISPAKIYAQSIDSVTINLANARENMFSKGTTMYDEITSIETNSSELQGITVGSGYSSASVADDSISVSFPVKIPFSDNPNRVSVKDAKIDLDVDSIETKPDGLKTFYGKPGFLESKIGDIAISEGKLEQISNKDAKLTLMLK